MNSKTEPHHRRPRLASLVAVGAGSLALAVAAGCGDDDGASVAAVEHTAASEHAQAASPQIHTKAGHAFQDEMRKLWEDHVTWTRLAIVSFVDDLPDLNPTVARLLQNQKDIGDAIKPYYGDRAGDRLTELLEDHIDGAVELLTAAKAGDQPAVGKASAAWYRNGNQIADFLSAANPDNWDKAELRSMMSGHLDQTLEEATHRLKGNHRAEIRSYDEIHRHILLMSDALSDGIQAQFPERFE
jgi:hypothetical protein